MKKRERMHSILQQLHSDEQEQIKNSNERYISQINKLMANAADLKEKVQLLCNVTARFFKMRRD